VAKNIISLYEKKSEQNLPAENSHEIEALNPANLPIWCDPEGETIRNHDREKQQQLNSDVPRTGSFNPSSSINHARCFAYISHNQSLEIQYFPKKHKEICIPELVIFKTRAPGHKRN
jgi:hypothetical protein